MKMNYKAVVFDADETIFNNQGIHIIVTEKILQDLGISSSMANDIHSKWDEHYFAEQKRRINDNGFCIDRENNAQSLVLALKEFNVNISFEKAYNYWRYMIEEYSTKSKPYPDALELVTYLQKKNIRMAIVSNGDTEIINLRLENADIQHHFEFVIAPCEEHPLTKPDVKIFEKSLEILGISHEETVFVGDNPGSDILGANQMGMFSVLIDRYNMTEELEGLRIPNLRIRSLTEIKSLFK
ncbi:MAG: HAD family hydrolase [Asgard group archaeon]|nr:HAD family hydrolase [Asgard group archaeon]